MCAVKDTGPVLVRVVTKGTKASFETGLPMVEVAWQFWADGGSLDFLVLYPGSKHTLLFPFLFLMFVCVIYERVHVCACVLWTCLWTCMWKVEVSVGCLPLSFVSCLIFEPGDHWLITDLLGWLADWLCLCSTSTGIVLGIWIWVLVLLQEALTEPSPQPQANFFHGGTVA